MPTQNPRLTITLEPSTAAQLRRMSELTGNSQSRTVADLLAQSGPVFERLIAVLEAAHVARDQATEEHVLSLQRAQAKIEEQLGIVLDAMDDGSRPLLTEAEKIARRTRRRPRGAALDAPAAGVAGAVPTPLSNRGVRSDPRTGGNQATARVPGHLARAKSRAAK